MKKNIFIWKQDSQWLISLLSKNKKKIVTMYQDAFGINSPYKEDRSNSKDVISAITSPLDNDGAAVVWMMDSAIVWVTTIYPLLIDAGKDDLIQLLCSNFDVSIEEFQNNKVMYACDTFVDKNCKRKWIWTELYKERLQISKNDGYKYFVWTTSSEESNMAAIAYHKKNWMQFSEKWYKIASAYSDAIRYLMLQTL